MIPATITIGLAPEIHLGPITIAWHGLTIAAGILAGVLLAGRLLKQQQLSTEPLHAITALIVFGGIVGGRLFYIAEHGGTPIGTRGFTFDGGFILAGLLVAGYIVRNNLDRRYLDAIAVALPLGVAIGRIGDVINGEHYGAPSTFFLAVRNSHPDALTPNPAIAYQNGGLYEVLLALLIFAVMWLTRNRLPRPGDSAWLVLALFSAGRFFEFFLRDDSPNLALGLSNAQWTSLTLLTIVVAARLLIPANAPRPADPG